MKPLFLLLVMLLCRPALAFDQSHAEWNALLSKHVAWQPGGHESKVAYAGLQRDRAALQSYLAKLSAVPEPVFNAWNRNDRLAFLINAYNAYTIELILTRYPDLKSIQDLGSLISPPWKKRFFRLLGTERHLDNVEHDMIRAPGAYDDPRIHMAVNCASIGCPALRPEAYVGARLDAQLDDQALRFLSDRTRNRYSRERKALEVSKIFDWYGKDFRRGYRGVSTLEGFLAGYAAQLADTPEDQRLIREGKAKLRFLDYDWTLNDRKG
jgi:hypothetical protein